MNNKHLPWNKEINNNFIIASRAYFLQPWDTEHLSHSPFSGPEREEERGMLAMLEWSFLAISEDSLRVVPNGSEIQSL